VDTRYQLQNAPISLNVNCYQRFNRRYPSEPDHLRSCFATKLSPPYYQTLAAQIVYEREPVYDRLAPGQEPLFTLEFMNWVIESFEGDDSPGNKVSLPPRESREEQGNSVV
jgi:hypothetical protein